MHIMNILPKASTRYGMCIELRQATNRRTAVPDQDLEKYKHSPAYRAYDTIVDQPHCDAGRLTGQSTAAMAVRRIGDGLYITLVHYPGLCHNNRTLNTKAHLRHGTCIVFDQ